MLSFPFFNSTSHITQPKQQNRMKAGSKRPRPVDTLRRHEITIAPSPRVDPSSLLVSTSEVRAILPPRKKLRAPFIAKRITTTLQSSLKHHQDDRQSQKDKLMLGIQKGTTVGSDASFSLFEASNYDPQNPITRPRVTSSGAEQAGRTSGRSSRSSSFSSRSSNVVPETISESSNHYQQLQQKHQEQYQQHLLQKQQMQQHHHQEKEEEEEERSIASSRPRRNLRPPPPPNQSDPVPKKWFSNPGSHCRKTQLLLDANSRLILRLTQALSADGGSQGEQSSSSTNATSVAATAATATTTTTTSQMEIKTNATAAIGGGVGEAATTATATATKKPRKPTPEEIAATRAVVSQVRTNIDTLVNSVGDAMLNRRDCQRPGEPDMSEDERIIVTLGYATQSRGSGHMKLRVALLQACETLCLASSISQRKRELYDVLMCLLQKNIESISVHDTIVEILTDLISDLQRDTFRVQRYMQLASSLPVRPRGAAHLNVDRTRLQYRNAHGIPLPPPKPIVMNHQQPRYGFGNLTNSNNGMNGMHNGTMNNYGSMGGVSGGMSGLTTNISSPQQYGYSPQQQPNLLQGYGMQQQTTSNQHMMQQAHQQAQLRQQQQHQQQQMQQHAMVIEETSNPMYIHIRMASTTLLQLKTQIDHDSKIRRQQQRLVQEHEKLALIEAQGLVQ